MPSPPSSQDELLRQALTHHQAGRREEARLAYEELLRIHPDHRDVWHLSGVLAWQAGNLAEGLRRVRRALALAPRQALFWNSLGAILRDQPENGPDGSGLEEAAHAFAKAVECDPGLVAAWTNLAAIRSETGRFTEAIAAATRATELQPDFADAHINLGQALRGAGCLEEAERELRTAVQLAPNNPQARNNLGSLLYELGRTDETFSQYEAAIRADSQFAPAWINLGQAAQTRGDWQLAANFYRQAAEIQASDGLRLRAAMCLPVIPVSTGEIVHARAGYEARLSELEAASLVIAEPLQEVGTTPLHLSYQGLNDCDLQTRLARLERRATPDLAFVAPHCRQEREPRPERRMRVGFVSQHWYNHSNTRLMAGLVRSWPRERCEVVLFSFAGREEPWSRFMAASADRVRTLSNSWRLAREELAAEQLDVLIYTDLGMEPTTRALAHARLAPVQMTTWGVPVTTGLDSLDAFVTSRLLEPASTLTPSCASGFRDSSSNADDIAWIRSSHYVEPLLDLPLLPTVYVPPYQILTEGAGANARLTLESTARDPTDVRPLAEARRRAARTRLGVTDDTRLYVCPQSLFKLHPDFDGAIDDILQLDDSGLILFVGGRELRWTELFRERLAERIGPRAGRVHVLSRMPAEAFQDLLAATDVMLDPWRFGGGNTTLEGLSWGVPILTSPGEFLRGRVTLGCYRQMGLTTLSDNLADEWPCVVPTETEYAARAVQIATDKELAAHLRERILNAAPGLFHRTEVTQLWCSALSAGQSGIPSH